MDTCVIWKQIFFKKRKWQQPRVAEKKAPQKNFQLPGSHVMSSAAEQERITFLSSCFSPLLQPSQRADPASTTAGSTRTARASSPTVNTSAHASTARWDVSPCARRNSPCPTWAAQTHDWLKWRASAARSGCATMASRPTSWKESLAKTC